jgi:hypothetical protein
LFFLFFKKIREDIKDYADQYACCHRKVKGCIFPLMLISPGSLFKNGILLCKRKIEPIIIRIMPVNIIIYPIFFIKDLKTATFKLVVNIVNCFV